MTTIAEMVRARADDDGRALVVEGRSWTWRQWVAECAARAGLWGELRTDGPPHIGVLLDNVPDYSFWLGAAAVAGAVVVGVNPTRRGAELERDIRHTDCQVIVTGDAYRPLLDGLDVGVPAERVIDIDAAPYEGVIDGHRDASLPDGMIGAGDGFLLLFTSGTTGAPKACWCTQGRLAAISEKVVAMFELAPEDVCYQAMPLFHSNALMAGWGPALAAGAATALRRRFSASGFLPDVRRYQATYFNYVGKPLSYILATPPRDDDADNSLIRVFGNEGGDGAVERFANRFGCRVTDGYGSTEGGMPMSRSAGTPQGSLGTSGPGGKVVDPDTGEEKARARFDEHGRLVNADEAIGEMVYDGSSAAFEGYYNNPEASAARVREGRYWTGDLGYRDGEGWFYFAGRTDDWLRVDGENMAAAPIERIINRHPDVALVALYAVPDPAVGDQAMAALQLRQGASFDGTEFGAFVDRQEDLGPLWAPRFVRVVDQLPTTRTNKILKRSLRDERWDAPGVWWRDSKSGPYRPFTVDDSSGLRQMFVANAREDLVSG